MLRHCHFALAFRNCLSLARATTAAAGILVLLCQTNIVRASDWGNDLDDVIAMPGTTVVERDDASMGRVREVTTASNVTFTQYRDKKTGALQFIGNDNNRFDGVGGGVFCGYRITAPIYLIIEKCKYDIDTDIKDLTRDSILRYEEFMIRNSTKMTPFSKTTISNIKIQISKTINTEACIRNKKKLWGVLEWHDLKKLFDKQKLEKFLSIDRPPVLNPCV